MNTDVLIIGAGPFGLALAAQLSHHRIDHIIVGHSMEFWRRNMPNGMFLRSASDWHLDPLNIHTIHEYLRHQNKTPKDVEPLSLEFYLNYAEWFRQEKNIQPIPVYIKRLDREDATGFVAATTNGDPITAKRVVIAPGFKHFANIPEELRLKFAQDTVALRHTSEFCDFTSASDKRFLIIGGRQSAFEWAALLLEAGAREVHISHRHASPAFAVADWSWVSPLVEGMVENPSWYRNLTKEEQDAVSHRQWAEGRLKVEPWLKDRLDDERVKVWPNTQVESCIESDGELLVTLAGNNDDLKFVGHYDEIVLATGYKVDIRRLPLLANGKLLDEMETRNGFPVLSDHLETSIPGLFMTSMPAMQDFGPFFGFTISVRTSAKLISERLRH